MTQYQVPSVIQGSSVYTFLYGTCYLFTEANVEVKNKIQDT